MIRHFFIGNYCYRSIFLYLPFNNQSYKIKQKLVLALSLLLVVNLVSDKSKSSKLTL
jgi:hypothetical protein